MIANGGMMGLKESRELSKEQRQELRDFYISRNQYFGIEKSPSSKASCRLCKQNIILQSLRLRHLVCGNKCRTGQRDICGNWHLECLLKTQIDTSRFEFNNPGFTKISKIEQLAGYSNLSVEDYAKVVEKLITI